MLRGLFLSAPDGQSLSGFSGHLLGLGNGFIDIADHVEGLLWQVVIVTIDQALEAADRVFQRHELTAFTCWSWFLKTRERCGPPLPAFPGGASVQSQE